MKKLCAVSRRLLAALWVGLGLSQGPLPASEPNSMPAGTAWRAEHRVIDLHLHIDAQAERVRRAVRILDRAGVGVGVNLTAGTVTHAPGEISEFQRAKSMTDRVAPGRFLHYMNLDYSGWDEPEFSEKAARQIEEGVRQGAAGFKEYKRLGLYLRDKKSELIKIDDPKLDAVWAKCGELNLPVSIHVADPRAFWLPYSQQNERWKELKDHPKWWFGDPQQFPRREDLLAALDRVISRHPRTTFVCVHFANNAEELDWVEAALDRHANMYADLAARIPEVGRHDPARVRRLFLKYPDRFLFGTDFQVYERLTLGSAGDAERPTDEEGVAFYTKCWRWLETEDRDWPHMTPIQGDWKISGIGLPPEVLRKVYFDNARRLLVRSLPFETLTAHRIASDFLPNGRIQNPAWRQAAPLQMERRTENGEALPELSTTCRALWSDKFLYLAYECPFTRLTVFEPVSKTERIQSPSALWDKDVVEAFIGSDLEHLNHYTEFEWAPTGERLDLRLRRPESDFAWSSGMESEVRVDRQAKRWRVEVRIPLSALAETRAEIGTRWRLNLYRIDRAHKAFLAMNPTLNGSFHTPERFGWLEFGP